MLTLTSSGFSAAAAPPEGPFQQILGWLGDQYRRPVAGAGGSYIVDAHDPTLTEPRIKLDISCTILVYNAGCETIVEESVFNTFCSYIKHNIERTWSTNGNNCLSKNYYASCKIDIRRVYDNTGTLQDGEIFIAIKRGEGRSFIEPDGRAGIFYISGALHQRLNVVYKSLIAGKKKATAAALAKLEAAFDAFGNTTPAHEFGHVLGLADRYAYIGYVWDAGGSKPDHLRVIVERGHTVPLYVHSGDPEYSEHFGWLFNLMSTQKSPRASNLSPPPKFWDGDDPERDSSVTVHEGQAYTQQFPAATSAPRTSDIGVTSAQLAVARYQGRETIPGSALVYFKKIPAGQYPGSPGKYVFKGTFVGLAPDAGGLHIVHDDHFDLSRNTSPLLSSSWNTNHDLQATDDKMEFRSCVIPITWKNGDSVNRAGGFVGAAIDIGATVSKFMAETEAGGVAVPARLTELLDIVNLDAKVTIRHYVGDYIQSCLDKWGALAIAQVAPKIAGTTTGTPPPPIRYLDHLSLDEIRKVDSVFTPKTDLFATNADVLPDYPTIDQSWLLVPYDYPGRNSFRKGATLFHTGPPPLKDGQPIPIAAAYPLAVIGSSPINPSAIAGWIYGTDPVEIAYAQSIWNAYHSEPPMNQFWKYDKKYIMAFEAPMHLNRSKIIALHKNGALRENGTKTVNNITVIDRIRLDPTNWKVTRCFAMGRVRYAGVNFRSHSTSNTNKLGEYLYVKRIL